jgi:hypothetical protein
VIIMSYLHRDEKAQARHCARAEEGDARVWVGPYETEHRAITKACEMARAALANGEVGDFIVDPATGSYKRRAVSP